MIRLAGVVVVLACALIAGAAEAASFKRGATLVEFFNFAATTGEGAARSYANPPFPKARAALERMNFADLRQLGFDHMRVPIDLGPMMWGDEAQRRDILEQLKAVIAALHRHELAALVTLYPPSLHRELPETYLDGLDGPKFRLYFAMVERVAAALKDVGPGTLALEPMNEPQSKCKVAFGTDWTAYQEFMIERLRRIAPDMLLTLTGGCWSNIEGIVILDTPLLRDPRNLVSVHFYYPFLFTHQGATWTVPYLAGVIGVPYPASAGSLQDTLSLTNERLRALKLPPGTDPLAVRLKAEAEIREYFAENQDRRQVHDWMRRVADWQRRHGIESERIVFTEFGAMKQKIDGVEIDRTSRVRWFNDTVSEIEGRGWGWTVYVLRDDPFGLYEHALDRYPDPALLRALRLTVPKDGRAAH